MRYEFVIEQAAATIGFGLCRPPEDLEDAQAVAHLEARPMDEFMHRHLLRRILDLGPARATELAALGGAAMATVLAEAALLRPDEGFVPPPGVDPALSPLVDLRQEALTDQAAHRAWSALLRGNLMDHAPLPGPGGQAPDVPFSPAELDAAGQGFPNLAAVASARPRARREKPVPPAETSRRAEDALARSGVELSRQMRHQMSLSPVGLVRRWRRTTRVDDGGLSYSLAGEYDSFGRGLAFEDAQAALLMEICERYSSWVDVGPEGPLGLARPAAWTRARFSELGPDAALDPRLFPLEAAYADEPLCWLGCEGADGRATLAPAQMIFLFANLDEPALFSGLGSTGLASGNTMAQARRGALLESLERDAEATAPHDPARVFRIRARDARVRELLDRYAARGLDVLFEDITPAGGVPAYRAFAVGPEGQVAKGASASLCGARAALSAMLEVPYPFPFGPPSRPGPSDLPVRDLDDLPDHSTGSTAGDLALLEAWLEAGGRRPAYANLTRADLGIPVCRALVPGLELMADFDRNSRLSPRLLRRCLDMGRASGGSRR